MKSPANIKRSQIYQSIFDDRFMLETFGTLTPDVQTRTAYFFECWMEWRQNRVVLPKYPAISKIKSLLKDMGMKDLREYQIRNGELRFKTSDDLAFAKLNGLMEVIKNV